MPEAAAPDMGTPTPTPTPTTGTPATGTPPPTVESLQKQLDELSADRDKWKTLSREHENKGKKTEKDFEDFKGRHQSDAEKAIDDAKKAGRAEALSETGSRLVDAEVRVAAAGRNVDVDALLEGLDRSRFIDDAGEPKKADITAWIDKVAPKPEGGSADPSKPRVPDLGQGARGGGQALHDNPLFKALTDKVPPRPR